MQYLGSAERQTEPYALASREKKYKRIAAYLSFWIVGYARVREPLCLELQDCINTVALGAMPGTEIVHLMSNRLLVMRHLTSLLQMKVTCSGRSMLIGYTRCWEEIQSKQHHASSFKIGFFFFFFHIIKGFFQFPACTLPNLELSEAQKLRGSREVSSRSQDTKPIDRIRTALTYIVDGSCRYRKEWSLASFQKRTQWNDTVSGTLLFLPYFFDHPVASLGPSEYKASRR